MDRSCRVCSNNIWYIKANPPIYTCMIFQNLNHCVKDKTTWVGKTYHWKKFQIPDLDVLYIRRRAGTHAIDCFLFTCFTVTRINNMKTTGRLLETFSNHPLENMVTGEENSCQRVPKQHCVLFLLHNSCKMKFTKTRIWASRKSIFHLVIRTHC